MSETKALVWFRRDLRDYDHAALAAALTQHHLVYCAFVFDTEILSTLPSRQDRRVDFIRESLVILDAALRQRGGGLIVRHGPAREIIPTLCQALGIAAVFANRDYEPAAKYRDEAVGSALAQQGCRLYLCKDQVIFEQAEILTQSGKPYTVFTPYRNAWLKRLNTLDYAEYDCSQGKLKADRCQGIPTLSDIGFEPSNLATLGITPGMTGAQERWDKFSPARLKRYAELRDYPAIPGVSYLSVHLRFGTISIRKLVNEALRQGANTWLNELIWRDFYFMILDRFPHVENHSFKPEYDRIIWSTCPEAFNAWKQGRTGYPLVDAAMRQLLHSGWMHNRLRMLSASFLTKDLGIDWRQGEAWFAEHLIDFDLAANNGGWQWSASSGCDAQPYFRIFNPVTQSEKFDPEGRFIRRYIPEIAPLPDKYIHAPWLAPASVLADAGIRLGTDYPRPIVEHGQARQETLMRYAVIKEERPKDLT